jgi:DNA-binding transcriptional ArsR family regulator
MSKSAVADSLRRLVTKGWLVREAHAGARAAGVYRLTVPTGLDTAGVPVGAAGGACGEGESGALNVVDRTLALAPHPEGGFPAVEVVGLVSRSHDAMSRDGLGQVAGLLADILAVSVTGCDVGELEVRTGLRGRTIVRHLRRLQGHGLVSVRGNVWHAAPALSRLENAARRLGVTGAVGRRGEQYRAETAVHAWWLADRHAELGYASLRGLRGPGRGQHRRTRVPVPRMVFPREADGRASWRRAVDMVLAGGGLQADESASVDLDGRLAARSASSSAGSASGRSDGLRRPFTRSQTPLSSTA